MESGSLQKELLEHFQFSVDTPSASAFSQQRAKLLPEALPFLFYEFNALFPLEKKYKGSLKLPAMLPLPPSLTRIR